MKSSNPVLARVVAEINIHEAVAAIEHFAENFPEDRHSLHLVGRLNAAATKMMEKAQAQRMKDIEAGAAKLRAGASMDTVIDTLRAKLVNRDAFPPHTASEELRDGKPYCGMCQTPGCPWCYPKLDTMSTFVGEPVFNIGGCVSGRFDSSKENQANTPKSRFDEELGDVFCRGCYAWQDADKFKEHAKTCVVQTRVFPPMENRSKAAQ